MLDLDEIERSMLTGSDKGLPSLDAPIRLSEIGGRELRVLGEDLTLPLAVIRRSVLHANSRWMRDYLTATGARIVPHGKTTMAPQLFDLQMRDGAWGITASTANHVATYRRAGVKRIILANQLVGSANIALVLRELERDREFDFYCLIDSVEGLELLLREIEKRPPGRPVQLLLEMGASGGRTGVRTLAEALELARRVAAAQPKVCLRGIETFEGVFDLSVENSSQAVDQLLTSAAGLARACDEEGLFAAGEILLTAGGSAYFDSVVRHFGDVELSQPSAVVLRSGCYLTHDSGFYTRAFARICARDGHAPKIAGALEPALEVWAYVQSIPEPGLAIATMGRRDVSFDMDLPVPLKHFRPREHVHPVDVPEGLNVTGLNDQHAYLNVPDGAELAVGDMLGFGVSHPCTTFDKWKYLFVVDDDYVVTDAIRTFF
ncbi:amino acid deaminase [Pacificimonas sp. WHA3]|uniref:Amino acid deaminase n=1 Tax=Pacificimonas pallii TaxID=2827236 RepID=A0ABS6SB32_9SPHN|nr:amino acid deaminase [Pacificimonas pallii]MBV7255303.1 amino acid deaminase [Pacificimonas pallii]